MGLKKLVKKILLPLSLSAIINGCSPSYDYTPNSKIILSHSVGSSGEVMEIYDNKSFLQGTRIEIPPGALESNQEISVGELNNPPAFSESSINLISGIDLNPNTWFSKPVTIQFHYSDAALSDSGVSDDSNLGVFFYRSDSWEETRDVLRNPSENYIQFQTDHFSYYAITAFNCMPPENLGNPQPGDLLYNLGSIFGKNGNGWRPGHVGIYTGEKAYPGEGLASDEVKRLGKYNVIEALDKGVQFSYFDPISDFGRGNVYMGARDPKNIILTEWQRTKIVGYAELQVGKPYAWAQTAGALFGMLRGSLVKGPDSFNCVGLAEKVYELAGVNNGEGLTTDWQEEFGSPASLTPAEQYNATKPATGKLENIAKNEEQNSNEQDLNSYGFSSDSDKVIGMINGNQTQTDNYSKKENREGTQNFSDNRNNNKIEEKKNSYNKNENKKIEKKSEQGYSYKSVTDFEKEISQGCKSLTIGGYVLPDVEDTNATFYIRMGKKINGNEYMTPWEKFESMKEDGMGNGMYAKRVICLDEISFAEIKAVVNHPSIYPCETKPHRFSYNDSSFIPFLSGDCSAGLYQHYRKTQ